MDFPGEKIVLKLWETLAEKGIGNLFAPWHEERMGKARNRVKRDEILMLAEADKLSKEIKAGNTSYSVQPEVQRIGQTCDPTKQERVEPTFDLESFASNAVQQDISESIRKEVNVCKAALIAEEILSKTNQEPPNEQIEEDWLYAWRDYAGRVSSSELQDLWGRVLAGEFKSPGSYSFRTLEFIKSLSKSEAEIISKAAKYVITGRILRNKEKFLEKDGLHFSALLYLQEIGVLTGVDSSGLKTTWNSVENDRYVRPLISNNKIILVEHDDINKKLVSEVYTVTSVGQQVLELASFGSDFDYLMDYAKDCANKGYKVILADWVPSPDGKTGNYYHAINVQAEK